MALLLLSLLACSEDYSFGTKGDHAGALEDSADPSVDTADTSSDTADTDTADPGVNEQIPDTSAPDPGVPRSGTPGTPDTGTPDTGIPDTGTPDTGIPDTGDSAPPDTGDTAPPEDLCDYASRTEGYLDTFQVPGDGQVLFCHNQGGGHFTEINTDISACEPHLDHNYDVFPTTGCDS